MLLGCGLAVLILMAGWMLHDAPLEPQAQAWLDAVEARQAGSSEAFDWMLGLDAPLDVDPRQLGHQRREAHAAQLASGSGATPAIFETPDGSLPVPAAEQICHVAEATCLARIDAGELDPQRLLNEYAVLLQRYRQALALVDYRTLTAPGPNEPLPPFMLMIQGNQLLALQAVLLARQGEAAAAAELVEEDIVQLRRQLASSDQLIGKMVWARLLGRDLDLLARLRVDELINAPGHQPELADAERDLLPVLQREFAMKAQGMLALRDSEALQRDFPVPGIWLFFKPRQTVNLMFEPDREVAERSRLDAATFAQHLEDRRQPALRPWQQPDNPIGVILANVASPDFNTYLARLHDLQAKLQLFNLLRQLPPGKVPTAALLGSLENADNPYQPGQLPTWNGHTGQLCFDGPLPDRHANRCLLMRKPTGD